MEVQLLPPQPKPEWPQGSGSALCTVGKPTITRFVLSASKNRRPCGSPSGQSVFREADSPNMTEHPLLEGLPVSEYRLYYGAFILPHPQTLRERQDRTLLKMHNQR